MLFNSIDFAVFLPIVFILYWVVSKYSLKTSNILIVVASFIFYGWWDWRFLFLILISILIDYFIGLWIDRTEQKGKRKLILWISIIVNLGILGFFKYYNFFIDNFHTLFSFFGSEIKINSLNIILPVGISFYTFQTLSYTIDIYRRKLKPTKDFIAFAAFVSFFPQLVAGPIERATNLLPQFQKTRRFKYDKAADGMRQILWGLFKKIVIADNAAIYVNQVFENYPDYNGSTLLLGATFFAFQIYGDFSGYSDIAIGTARLFGVDLMRNFHFPYFSRDIAEFWRRWHISLSTWFRDYLYIPLGGSRGSNWMKIRNTFIIFIVSGFWHGANWTFIVWGALNALYFLPLLLTNRNRNNLTNIAQNRVLPNLKEFFQIGVTFLLTVFAWIFFRAESVNYAYKYIIHIFNHTLFSKPEIITSALGNYVLPEIIILLILSFVIIEWVGRDNEYAIEKIGIKWNWIFRYAFYSILIVTILLFSGEDQQFIYFQF